MCVLIVWAAAGLGFRGLALWAAGIGHAVLVVLPLVVFGTKENKLEYTKQSRE